MQRIISHSCFQLEYYLSHVFIFKADNYNAAQGRLSTIDRRIFYDRSTVNVNQLLLSQLIFIYVIYFFYCLICKWIECLIDIFDIVVQMNIDTYCCNAAYGVKVFLAKEKPESSLKARKLYQRLWFLDISTKILLTYWILQNFLSYFNIMIH